MFAIICRCGDCEQRVTDNERVNRTPISINAGLEHLFLAFENNCAKLYADKPIVWRLSCSVVQTLVSGNIKFVRVFAGVL